MNFIKKYAHYFILGLGGLYLIVLPIFNQFSAVDWNWQGFPLDVPNYYYARMREILDGFPFMGNPYFFEYRNELAPAFFLADWIVALPMFILSMGAASILNIVMWTALFIGLCYWFLREISVSKTWSAVGALLSSIAVYSYLITPVSMQVIYPVFVLFLIALWQWLRAPLSKKTTIFLIVATVLTFYIYTYLWQLAVVFLGLFFLYFLRQKEYRLVGRLVFIGLITLVLSSPLFVYTWKQISHPFYWDTMERIGLVYTHVPTALVLYSGKWIISLTLLWYVLYYFVKTVRENTQYKKISLFFGLLGFSLIITGLSNVFMGKELETMQHIDRFSKIWFVMSALTWLYFVKTNYVLVKEKFGKYTYIFGFIVCLILLGGSRHYFAGEVFNLVPKINSDKHALKYQSVIQSLQWLENTEKEPVVIWSDSPEVNSMVPVVTKHYVLFANYGILHLLSSKEVEERYLIARYFDTLTVVDLQANVREYAGSAHALHKANTNNRWVKICHFAHLETMSVVDDCGQITSSVTLLGDSYFADLLSKHKMIQSDILGYLAKYQITYMVKDKSVNSNFAPEKIPGTKKVYEDVQIQVYKVVNN